MKFGILGYGIVGKATHLGLLKDQSVVMHDPKLNTELKILADCQYAFICIPTASNQDIDTLIAEIKAVKKLNKEIQIIIRSTVPVGTCAKIVKEIKDNVIYMPEFLRERFWQYDCYNRPIIVGGRLETISTWLDAKDCVFCSLEEAEIIKMLSNTMASTRVVLANHFYELSKCVGADYQDILSAYLKVNHDTNYLEVNDKLRGFGGKCLPKDLDFLINTFADFQLQQNLFSAVKTDNQLWPTTIKTF